MIMSIEEKIKFRDEVIYVREDELLRIVDKYDLDNIYVNRDNIKINFNIKKNQQAAKIKDTILNEFKELSYVDEVIEKGRFTIINHSSDVKEEIDAFYSDEIRLS